jgi:DNA-binding NarL/FixJ family response regulator
MAYLRQSHTKAIALLAQGLSDKEIASRLGIQVGTLKTYLTHARAQLGLTSYTHTRTQAAMEIDRKWRTKKSETKKRLVEGMRK